MSTAEAVLNALQPYDIKEKGRGSYRLNSPLRSGANSHSFALKIEGDENGTWFDHVTNEGGSLYDLADKLGIKRERAEVATTKRAYADRDEYAQAHGLPDSALDSAGWQYTTYANRPALAFPTKGGKRWRFLDGQAPHYISEKGYKRCWYGLARAKDQSLKAGCFIVCNGEISTIAAQFISLPAASVTGGEKGEIPAELMAELQATIPTTTRIVVAMDCDKTGRSASAKMVAQLIKAGYQAHAVDLNLSEGGDLADYCMLYKDQSLASLLALAPMTAPALVAKKQPKVYSLSDLANLPRPEWLLDSQLPKYGIGMVYGRAGIGKSFVMLNLAYEVAKDSPVLYVALEGRYGYRARLDALNTAYFTKDDQLNLSFWLDQLDLSSEESVKLFIETAIVAVKPALVVIDTLTQAMGAGDPNTPRDMQIVVKSLNAIQAACTGLVIVVHHARKADNTYAGSSVLYNSSDVVIAVKEYDGRISFENEKQKDGELFDTRYLKLVPIQLTSGEMVPVPMLAEKVRQTVNDKLTKNQYKTLEVLAETFGEGTQLTELLDVTELPKASQIRALSTLRLLGFVEQNGARGMYKITTAGEQKIGKRALTIANSNNNQVSVSSGLIYENEKNETENTSTTPMETASGMQSLTENHALSVQYNNTDQNIYVASETEPAFTQAASSNSRSHSPNETNETNETSETIQLAFDQPPPLKETQCPICNNRLTKDFRGVHFCLTCRSRKRQALETQSPDEAVIQ